MIVYTSESPVVRALAPRTSATLTLSSDAVIEYILADIPFLCVGLVAFAFFAFMLFMKRVTLLSVYLYSTALFGFSAAVIDLAQILVRGTVKVDMNTGMTSGITALINTREVGLSIAIGSRFLFFWAFVAERPRGEPPPTTDLRDPNVYAYYAENSHSAKWERWGYLGLFLKWLILASIISIPILQIIWRIAVRHYGVVYMVESTIEILISALLLLKVCLNVFLSPISPWWKPFRFYVVPLIALLVNVALGIAELVYFLFSETPLGRFLQAFEVYSMLIFLMLVAFYKVPVRPMRPRNSTPYVVEKKSQDLRSPIATNLNAAEPVTIVDDPQSRLAIVPRVGSWIASPRHYNKGRQDAEDLEAALSPSESQPIQRPTQPMVLEQSPQGTEDSIQNNISGSLSPQPELSVEDSDLFVRPIPAPAAFSSSVLLPEKDRRESRTSTGVSLRYYGVGGDSFLSFPNPSFMANDESSLKSSGTNSPIYGLDGIMNQQTSRNSAASSLRPPRRPSMSSFDELMQQQAELDRIIVALPMFSPPTPSSEVRSPPAPSPDATSPETTDSNNNRTVSTITTSSARSEFSLSIFPDPPTAGLPVRASFTTMRANRMKRQSRRDVPTSFDNVSLDVPSLPDTPRRLAPGRSFGSNATQYDVTSFIGHLTRPSLTEGPVHADVANPTSLTDKSDNVKVETESEHRQTDIPVDDVIAAAAPSKQASYPQLRPFFLGNVTTSPAVSSPLAEGAHGPTAIPVGPRRPVRGRLALPSNPRPMISGPRQSSLDQAPGAFERPRPPPSFPPSDLV
ncbi:hypothetical protein J3R30DRAFT_3445759 [Lentinula aciculospora]|uniref:Uncharacterized protein n=1 Tax=Lentinula aciculospora TaxID=153920 RepID=A0A9W9AMD0_9AGAR|nr:hypothetical protein J3R30DRAFT_3445759 [Lentinula aciculospora]